MFKLTNPPDRKFSFDYMKDLAAKGYSVPDWCDIQMEEEDAEEEQLLKKRASSKSLPPDVQQEEEKIDVGTSAQDRGQEMNAKKHEIIEMEEEESEDCLYDNDYYDMSELNSNLFCEKNA